MERNNESRPPIVVEELSESRRIFSTTHLRTDEKLITDIVNGIKSHPYIDEVGVNDRGPSIDFVVDVTHPEYWDNYIDPHCRQIIELAIEAQQSMS
jgi:hypothetical protein